MSNCFTLLLLTTFAGACTGRVSAMVDLDDSESQIVVLEGDALTRELNDSPVREADSPFVRIGAIWEAERPGTIEVSVSADGSFWSPWTPMNVQHIELESGLGSFTGQLEFEGSPARYYRLRSTGGDADYARIQLLRHRLSDSIEGGEVGVQAMLVGDSDVYSRAEWGAQSARCSSSLGDAYRMSIHHTETPTNDNLSPQARLRSIQSYHQNTLGWCDIGYHFLMSRDGRLWQARPSNLMGAHTGGANTGNIGIAVMGSHSSTPITSEQVDKLAGLIGDVAEQEWIDIDRDAIKGHRQYKSTSCPGDALYDQLDMIVDLAASGPGQTPPPAAPEVVRVLGVLYVGSDTSERIDGATVTLGAETTTTNSVGLWSFDEVPTGSFTVTASADGYETRSLTRTTYADDTWASFGLSVADDPVGTAVLQGVIYYSSDSSNRIPDATISLSTGDSITTDANGFYRLTNLPAGLITITASADGWTTESVERYMIDGETEWGSVRLVAEEVYGSEEVGGPGSTCERCDDFDFLCCNVPANDMYYLTSFDGGESMACGGYADGVSYYSTSWVRWGCGGKLQITNPENGACVVVEVKDAGPADWVEEYAGGPIVDASTQVCRDLFNSSSCGWSDQRVIEAIAVPDSTPTGPAGCW